MFLGPIESGQNERSPRKGPHQSGRMRRSLRKRTLPNLGRLVGASGKDPTESGRDASESREKDPTESGQDASEPQEGPHRIRAGWSEPRKRIPLNPVRLVFGKRTPPNPGRLVGASEKDPTESGQDSSEPQEKDPTESGQAGRSLGKGPHRIRASWPEPREKDPTESGQAGRSFAKRTTKKERLEGYTLLTC